MVPSQEFHYAGAPCGGSTYLASVCQDILPVSMLWILPGITSFLLLLHSESLKTYEHAYFAKVCQFYLLDNRQSDTGQLGPGVSEAVA